MRSYLICPLFGLIHVTAGKNRNLIFDSIAITRKFRRRLPNSFPFKKTPLVLRKNLIVPFRGTQFPVGKFKFQKGFFDLASGKRTASETAPGAAPLAFVSQKTLRTRSLPRRYLIRRRYRTAEMPQYLNSKSAKRNESKNPQHRAPLARRDRPNYLYSNTENDSDEILKYSESHHSLLLPAFGSSGSTCSTCRPV